LDSIDTSTVVGLRDRALSFAFARSADVTGSYLRQNLSEKKNALHTVA
jgi:hypothetical protein